MENLSLYFTCISISTASFLVLDMAILGLKKVLGLLKSIIK